MMLGGCEDIESCIVGQDRQPSHFVQHLLVPLRVPANRAEPFPILERAGHSGKNEEHEFHCTPPRDMGPRAGRSCGAGRRSWKRIGRERTRSVSFIAPISRPGAVRTKSHRGSANGERVALGAGPVKDAEATEPGKGVGKAIAYPDRVMNSSAA